MRKVLLTNIILLSTIFNYAQTEVGITEGELNVSLSGNASYAIPILTPPGLNGVEPKISLSYSSQSGNGQAGYGWNISGLSSISRIPSSKYHDGVQDPVDFDAFDRFSFDGQRLVVKGGTSGLYGANLTQYETEVFSNIKITSYGVHTNGVAYGPSYFIVQYPDGSVARYGDSNDSRSITTWSLTYWENPQGVRINYDYTIITNTMYLSTIKYGSIGATQSLNEVQFNYIDRTHKEQAFVQGLSIDDSKILSSIIVKGNNTNIRNYILEHIIDELQYQKLTKVTEKDGAGILSLNPTVFNYGITTPANNNSYGIYDNIHSPFVDYKIISGDYDGDGKSDYVFYDKNFSAYMNIKVYKNLVQSSYDTASNSYLPKNLPLFYSSPVQSIQLLDIFNSNQIIGSIVNGYKNSASTGWTTVTRKTFEANLEFKSFRLNDIGSAIILDNEKTINLSCVDDIYKDFINGDFNGDGITDLIMFDFKDNNCIASNIKVNYIDLDKRKVSNFIENLGNIPNSNYPINVNKPKIFVVEFNGDGKSDILFIDANGIRIFTLNKNNNQLIQLYNLNDTFIINKDCYPGDYNGDGKTDVAFTYMGGWNFYISTGLTFITFVKDLGFPTTNYTGIQTETVQNSGPPHNIDLQQTDFYLTQNYFVRDFNGDGKTDIGCNLIRKNTCTRTRTYNYNMGTNFTLIISPWVEDCFGSGSFFYTNSLFSKIASPVSSEINSINFALIHTALPDLVTSFNGNKSKYIDINDSDPTNYDVSIINTYTIFNSNYNLVEKKLLTKITNGNKVSETISYKPLKQVISNNVTIYTPASTNIENVPNIDLKVIPNLMVVSKIEKQSASTFKQKLFAYHGAVLNTEGLGFLGFRANMQTDWFDSEANIISNIYKNDIGLRGAVSETYKVLGLVAPSATFAPTTFIGKSINTYNTISQALQTNKVFKLKLNQSQQFNGLEITSNTTVKTYDNYNNITNATSTIKNGTITEKNNVDVTIYDNQPLATNYYIGKPTSKIITSTIYPGQADQDVSSNEELYTYTNQLLTKVKKRSINSGLTTDYLTEDTIYDTSGNITKKTITPVGAPARVTNYAYSPTYDSRFLTSITDSSGLITTYTYDNATGAVLSELLPSNSGFPLTTTYTNDVWGKKINTLNYLGNNQTVEYFRQNEKTLIITTTVATGGNTVATELLDDLGRKIRTGTKTLNGVMSFVDYEYDNFSKPTRVSEPFFGTSPLLWNQTSYDNYDRITQTTTAASKTTTYAYSGLTSTSNDGIKSKETVKNSLGNVTSLTETPGGTINYEYFANGNLKSSAIDSVVTEIKQDGWGRKKELRDPAAGVYTYTYNGFGEVLKETTPKGFTDYTYTSTGKLFTKWIKDAATPLNTNIKSTYDYNPTTKMLSAITVLNPFDGNNTFTYSYDDRRRLYKTIEEYTTIQPRTFTKQLSFDGYGRIQTEIISATAFNKSTSKTTFNTYLNGFMNKIYDGTSAIGTPLWELNSQNARGQTQQEKFGNNIAVTNTYDDYGFPTQTSHDLIGSNSSTNVFNLVNDFEESTGNLLNRTNSLFSWNEPFLYDAADRLTQFNNNLGQSVTQDYFEGGKIETNNLGTYNYTDAVNPYKNTSLSALAPAGQTFAARTQTITYNAFSSPIDITQTNERVTFGYNALQQRSVMYYGNAIADKFNRSLRKYYSADGSIEIKYTKAVGAIPEKVEFFTYIGGDAYSAPMVVRKIDTGNYENFYLHRDHLGSILAITNSLGAVVEKRLFDAWGKILKIQNGTGATLTKLTFFDRGYTGHEHMEGVELINMNGRIYDPQLHRFMQPDNNIQDPYNTQNFNRYGYVLNNPLKYTDESGEFWGFILGAILNAYISTAQSTGDGNPLNWNAQTWQSFGYNTASSAASYGATNVANSYVNNYNNKSELGVAAGPVPKAKSVAIAHDISNLGVVSDSFGNDDIFASAIPIALTLSAVDGPIPLGDAIGGVILAGATAYDASQRTFVTYTMRNPAGKTYVGRTSGYGHPYNIMMNRFTGHHMRAYGYNNPVLDRAVQGYQGYPAIRGREQQLIDSYGGIGSPSVGNSIRGVYMFNPAGIIYHQASNMYFGPLSNYTGFGN